MASKMIDYLVLVILYALVISNIVAKKEDLYRLIDKNIVCDNLLVIENLTVTSIPSCAMACGTKPQCGMFSMNRVFKNDSFYKLKKKKPVTCSLCKFTNTTIVEDKRGWSTYMVSIERKII